MNPYYRCFEASDGFVAVACLNLAQRQSPPRALRPRGRDRSTRPTSSRTTPAPSPSSKELTAAVAAAFAERSVAEWIALLEAAGVPVRPGAAARGDRVRIPGRRRRPRRPRLAAGLGEIDLLAPFVRVGGEPRAAAGGARPRRRHGIRPCGARVRFQVSDELALFAESTRAALGDWRAPLEPELGSWQDDRDDELAARVAAAGWSDLWAAEELLGAVVAGGIELGRAAAPVSLLDEATLGAPLCVEGRARHARGAQSLAVPLRGGGLGLGPPSSEARPEPTLDGAGTVRVEVDAIGQLEPVAAAACWRAWNAATLAYLAGLAGACARSWPSSTREPGSSSAPRSRRSLPSSPASRTPHSQRTPSPCSPGRQPRTDGWPPGAGAALRGRRLLRCRRPRTRCTARSASLSRRALHVYHRTRPLRVHAWATAAVRTLPAESLQRELHSGERICSMAQSSHSMRASVERIPPSRAIRKVRAFLFAPVGSSLMRRNSARVVAE